MVYGEKLIIGIRECLLPELKKGEAFLKIKIFRSLTYIGIENKVNIFLWYSF